MDMDHVRDRGLVLLGCGKMGSALLQGWLQGGLAAASVWVIDPNPSDWLRALDGLHLNARHTGDCARGGQAADDGHGSADAGGHGQR